MDCRKIGQNAVDKAVDSLIGRIVTALISLLAPGLLLSLLCGGFKYLFDNHAIPGWIVAVILGAVVILLLQLLRQHRRIRKPTPRTPEYKDEPFRHADLEWILTALFFKSYTTLMPEDARELFEHVNPRPDGLSRAR
jgi:hypothetical protein